MTFNPGSRIHDRYVIEALIGSAPAGKVYRAVDTRLARPVAVKVLEPEAGDDAPIITAATLREARAGAAIHHVNVAAIFDVDEVDGRAFIVMELVSGASLRAYVAGPTPIGQRVRWLADVASALDAAHQLGVVHRNVKPENVMVSDDGRVKVLDFGVARRSPDATALAAGSEEDRSPGADQLGWGSLAYELLTGRSLGVAGSSALEAPAPFAAELGIPGEVEAVVLRALAVAPADRFPSMSEVTAALEPFAASPLLFPGLPAVAAVERAGAPLAAPLPPAASRPAAPLVEKKAERVLRFRDPDFSAPVDLEGRIALLPKGAMCKGMIFQDLVRRWGVVRPASDLFKQAGVPERRYVAFRDYPMEENLRLLVAVAGGVHRAVPLGEGLRRIGQSAFDMVLGTHVGRTMLGVFGRDVESVFMNGMKVYGVLLSFGTFSCEKTASGRFLLRFEDFPAFIDTYEVGVAEGVLRHCGKRGRMRVAMERLDNVTVEVEIV